MDVSWLGKFFSWQLAAWSAFLLNLVAILKIRNERKRDINVEKAGDWDRLRIERNRLQELLTECQHERAELLKRAITAEATLLGLGEVRQLRAIADAKRRLTEGGDK